MSSEAVPLLSKNNIKVLVVTGDELKFHALLISALDLNCQHAVPAVLPPILIEYETQLTQELI